MENFADVQHAFFVSINNYFSLFMYLYLWQKHKIPSSHVLVRVYLILSAFNSTMIWYFLASHDIQHFVVLLFLYILKHGIFQQFFFSMIFEPAYVYGWYIFFVVVAALQMCIVPFKKILQCLFMLLLLLVCWSMLLLFISLCSLCFFALI